MLAGLSRDAKILLFFILTKKNTLFFKKRTGIASPGGAGETGGTGLDVPASPVHPGNPVFPVKSSGGEKRQAAMWSPVLYCSL